MIAVLTEQKNLSTTKASAIINRNTIKVSKKSSKHNILIGKDPAVQNHIVQRKNLNLECIQLSVVMMETTKTTPKHFKSSIPAKNKNKDQQLPKEKINMAFPTSLSSIFWTAAIVNSKKTNTEV